MGTTASPSGTASAPPGTKSFCKSTRMRACLELIASLRRRRTPSPPTRLLHRLALGRIFHHVMRLLHRLRLALRFDRDRRRRRGFAYRLLFGQILRLEDQLMAQIEQLLLQAGRITMGVGETFDGWMDHGQL